MISKSVVDLRTEIIQEILNRLPNLDLTEGTPERDMFVEAPIAGQLSSIWQAIVYVAKLHAPHVYMDDLETADLLDYMNNYGVTPASATYSEGVVTFYSTTLPTTDIVIPSGTVVQTVDATPIEFAVQGTHTLYQSIAASYYNANTGRWEINCSVKALVAGPASKAGAGAVSKITSSVTGITGVTNANPITGGADAETVEAAMTRVLRLFQGRGLGPTQGLINFISQYVSAINVAGANDPEMERDEGLGGCLDFYVIGEDLTDGTDTVSITSTGLELGTNVNYTSTGIILGHQPVHEIAALIINGVITPLAYYQLEKDTGMLAKSVRASDSVVITSTGLQHGILFRAGDVVEISYIYNALPGTVDSALNSPENYYTNRDYLTKEMTEVTINLYMKFKESSGKDFDVVADEVSLALSELINSIKNAGSLEIVDLISEAKKNSSVDNIERSTIVITPIGGGTVEEAGDVTFGKNEYPIAGNINLVRWTNQ